MLLKHDRHPARVALIIFMALVVFCMAQLAWWIIFQIKAGTTQRALCLKSANDKGLVAAALLNDRFQRLTHTAEQIFEDQRLDSAGTFRELDRLLDDNAVAGYAVAIGHHPSPILRGRYDSTFYSLPAPALTLYFEKAFVAKVAEIEGADLVFAVSGYHDGSEGRWVSPAMFAPSPAALARIEDRARRTITMFAFEGGFFLLVMLVGAYLIYRTLYRAEELKFAQQNFIHSVTHELKAPLAGIKLYLQTIMGGKIEPQRAKELFPKMVEDCDRLEGLIDNVLEAGHFSKDGYRLKLTVTNLADDVTEYLNELESLAHRYGGTIIRDVTGEVMVKSDYQALRRVVNALVDNALKYSPAGRREVTVTLERENSTCRLIISDRGQGIDKKDQSRIFERFYRGADDSARQMRGTGLGLFLVREIVEAHGGNVTVSSPGSDQGTTFIITLPVVTP